MSLLIRVFILGILSLPAVQAAQPSVLMVVSSHGVAGDKSRPGFAMDEFAKAYAVFKDNGLEIAVASPRGGPVLSDEDDSANPAVAALQKKPAALALLARTLPTDGLRAEDYQAVFVVGGAGAMADLPEDPALARFLAELDARQGILAAICHGPAAFLGLRRDGRPWLAGRQVSAFTEEEERLFGEGKGYRFVLEAKLREQGVKFSEKAPMLPHWVQDGRLITGQNPYATVAVAEALVRSLGKTPVARTAYADDASLALLERYLGGETETASRELQAQPQRYRADILGMYGYYALQAAKAEAEVSQAVAIMELAAPQFAHPQLLLAIAQGYQRLGKTGEALAKARAALAKDPGFVEAKRLVDSLEG